MLCDDFSTNKYISTWIRGKISAKSGTHTYTRLSIVLKAVCHFGRKNTDTNPLSGLFQTCIYDADFIDSLEWKHMRTNIEAFSWHAIVCFVPLNKWQSWREENKKEQNISCRNSNFPTAFCYHACEYIHVLLLPLSHLVKLQWKQCHFGWDLLTKRMLKKRRTNLNRNGMKIT